MTKRQNLQEWFASELDKIKDDPIFILEGVVLDWTEQIAEEMEKQNISKSELARRMGKKPAIFRSDLHSI